MSTPATTDTNPPSRGMRLFIAGFVLLNLLVIGRLAWFWYLSDPGRQVKVGPETTVIEGPLKEGGTVDYVTALNLQQSEGVTSDNNAVVLLVQAYGPQVIGEPIRPRYFDLLGVPAPPAEGSYLVGEAKFFAQFNPQAAAGQGQQDFGERRGTASNRPWTRAEFPDVAAMLDQNAAPLALIVEASRRERYYSPLLSSDPDAAMYMLLLPIEQEQREAARQLTARAMLKLGEGDASGAWDDLLATHRLSRLTGQSPFMIGALVSIAIEAMASESDKALVGSPALSADQARQCLKDLQSLPPLPSIADQLDRVERLGLLDATLQIARDPSQMSMMADSSASAPTVSGAVDWNIALELINDEIDKVVAAMREPDVATRMAQLEQFNEDLSSHHKTSNVGVGVRAFLGNRKSASTDMGWAILTTFMPAATQATTAEVRAHSRQQAIRTCFGLAAWQREHGSYPETLAALVPDLLPAAPIDPWSGKELIYRRTETGFIVYSVWDNMHDDGGIDFSQLEGGVNGDLVFEISGP